MTLTVHLLLIVFELLCGGLLHGYSNASNGVIVRAALQPREHGHVDLRLHVDILHGPPVEDDASPGPPECLVDSGGDHVTVGEGGGDHSGRHQPRHVGHVSQQPTAVLVRDGSEPAVVQTAGVTTHTRDDHLGLEQPGRLLQRVVVDEARAGLHLVRHRLEVDAGGRDLGLGREEAVREMPAVRQVQPHDAAVRLHQRGVHGEVCGGAAVGLDVDSPLCRVQAKQGQRPLLGQQLHLVNELVTAVVPLAGLALAVLVVQAGAQTLQHWQRREVLTGDHLQPRPLPLLLGHDDLVDLGVGLGQGHVNIPVVSHSERGAYKI